MDQRPLAVHSLNSDPSVTPAQLREAGYGGSALDAALGEQPTQPGSPRASTVGFEALRGVLDRTSVVPPHEQRQDMPYTEARPTTNNPNNPNRP